MNIDEMQAGPELDALVAKEAMGWTLSENRDNWLDSEGRWVAHAEDFLCGGNDGMLRFAPSAYIRDAWQVVKKLDLLANKILTKNEDGKYIVCDISYFGEWPDFYEGASESASAAICRAALKAVGER